MKALVSFNVIVELDESDQFLVNNPEKLREKILSIARELKVNNKMQEPRIINADFDIMLDRSGGAPEY